MQPTLKSFNAALERIEPYIKKTLLLRSTALEAHLKTSHRIFLKLENEQPTHSFKVRGAFNALLSLTPEQRAKGVVTRSTGNFAQAIAYAGGLLHIKAIVVMPTHAPEVKKRSTQQLGAELVLAGTTHAEGDRKVQQLGTETGAVILSPFNYPDVILGQGTTGLEVDAELPEVRHFFCPIGGGGLMSGCAAALKLLRPGIEMIGIEPEGAADYYLSRHQGHPVVLERTNTICDGLRAPQVGTLTRPLLDEYVDSVATVSDHSVIKAMKFLKDHHDLVVEPSGAASCAGLMHHRATLQGDAVCVISGSNVDAAMYDQWMHSLN